MEFLEAHLVVDNNHHRMLVSRIAGIDITVLVSLAWSCWTYLAPGQQGWSFPIDFPSCLSPAGVWGQDDELHHQGGL